MTRSEVDRGGAAVTRAEEDRGGAAVTRAEEDRGGAAVTRPEEHRRDAADVRRRSGDEHRLGPSARRFLAARKAVLARLAAWSVAESAQTFLVGYGVAQALDRGFLAGDTAAGLGWLALAACAVLLGAPVIRGVFAELAGLTEPLRDRLVRRAVDRSLARALARPGGGDKAAVSRLTNQVEMVRDSFAGVVLTLRSFVFTAAGCTRRPAVAAPRPPPGRRTTAGRGRGPVPADAASDGGGPAAGPRGGRGAGRPRRAGAEGAARHHRVRDSAGRVEGRRTPRRTCRGDLPCPRPLGGGTRRGPRGLRPTARAAPAGVRALAARAGCHHRRSAGGVHLPRAGAAARAAHPHDRHRRGGEPAARRPGTVHGPGGGPLRRRRGPAPVAGDRPRPAELRPGRGRLPRWSCAG
ncbi:hypothetical protein R2F25_01195 [Streptomyces sp. UP1A-1]|nr:hypothetical protein [Streptomyces sp. UP1A-1]